MKPTELKMVSEEVQNERFTYQTLWEDQYTLLWPLDSYSRKTLLWYVAKASLQTLLSPWSQNKPMSWTNVLISLSVLGTLTDRLSD